MVPLEEIQLGTIGPENTGEIELLQTWTFEEELGGLDWSPDSSQLAVGLLRRVQFLDIYAGKTGTKLEAPEDSRVPLPFSGPVTFNQDGSRITAGGSFGGAIIEWETATGEPTTDHIAVGANINAINYSPDGRKLAVGSSAGAFTLHLDLSGPRVFYANERGLDIVFHPTRALIGVADGGGQIAIWPVNGEQPLMEFDRFSFDIAFSPDGALLASTNEVWDVSTGDLVAELPQTETAQGHWSMNYHPSGDLLIVGTGSGPILVFEAEEYQLVEVLEHHSARVRDLDFSPDGKLLAASSDDGTVTIWGIKK